jgi:hypothetical protein
MESWFILIENSDTLDICVPRKKFKYPGSFDPDPLIKTQGNWKKNEKNRYILKKS